MKRNSRKDWKYKYDMLRVVRCKGAVCVSINEGYDRYFAENIRKKRNIKPITYYYEKDKNDSRVCMGTTSKYNRYYMEKYKERKHNY